MSEPVRRKRRVVKRKFNPLKALRLLAPVALFIFLCVVMCSHPSRHSVSEADIYEEATAVQPRVKAPVSAHGNSVEEIMALDTVSQYLGHLEKMPEPTVRIKVNYFGDMRRVFNDSNYIHWADAEKIGIRPLTDTRSHWQTGRPLTKVTTCADFYVDNLRYSRPFLVPEASVTLHEIGRRFRDTLAVRGGGDYRIKVTSLLRTPSTIKRLRRVNRNSVDSSVHQLGTTFDISYASFIASSPEPARSADDLKGVLGEVLKAMREEGKIYVKYERGQPCFHITARPR